MTPTAASAGHTPPSGEHTAAPPRGERLHLAAGPYRAEVSTVGATLEALTLEGRDLLVRSPEDGPMMLHRGAIIAPWPNRIGDGRYTWDGQEIQAPITEVERGNALHGLVSFLPFTVHSRSETELVLRTELFPGPGYPFHLLLSVHYLLDAAEGLSTTVSTQNIGAEDAPYGTCPHPYLVAGTEPLDTWTLQVEAGTVLEVSEDRLLPTGSAAITPGSPHDFSQPRCLQGVELDHAYTDLQRDAEGMATVRVQAPSGTGVQIRFGEECGWLQVHTSDRPEPENHRAGLAVEPMTCPPDAFRSGIDVVRLQPGATHSASWTISGW